MKRGAIVCSNQCVNDVCRITSFHDSWPKMEKWFTRFGTLKKVDASDQENAVFLEVEKIMEDTLARVGCLPLKELAF